MKTALLILSLNLSFNCFSQSVIGHWLTTDDNTGEKQSIVAIYEENGVIQGEIVKIFFSSTNRDPKESRCTKCSKKDARYNQKIWGMKIISTLECDKDKKECKEGHILDPKNGKNYRCRLWLEVGDKLRLRGYWGPFYRTQTWTRVNKP